MAQLQDAKQASASAQGGEQALNKPRIARGQVDLNTPVSPREGMRMAQEVSRPGEANLQQGDTDASPEEQEEYERATAALSKVLYEDDRTANSFAQQLTPEEKVGGVAKASMLVITQLDQQIDLDESIVAQFTGDVVDRVIDMYENMHGDEFSDQEAQAATGATWEGIMEAFGVDEDGYAEMTAGMSDEEFSQHEQQYKQMVGAA